MAQPAQGAPALSVMLAALAVGGLALGGLACDEPEPNFPVVAEPSEALRPADARGLVPEDAHVVDYWIDARLDERRHEIHGVLRVAWTNPTQRTTDRLPFHLYMNGFRAEDTVWMQDARGRHRGQAFARDRWGFINVSRVERLAANPQDPDGPRIALEQAPREGRTALSYAEDADPSTMTVTLDAPLGPGESAVLELEFTTRLPQVFARTGYYGDFHMAGQWFPKIGVLEEEGGWQAHAFALNSEFYADFGNYEVFLDVPAEHVVGASGIRVTETEAETQTPTQDGRKRLHYRAEMVHDFAWVADPNFVEHYGEYEGIRIRQLIQPEFVDDVDAHLAAQIAAFESMEARFGPYPWSTITIVHAPDGADGAGGMEYPTLYTTSDIADTSAIPTWLLEERMSGVFTTIHEFGHQYFQGLFASNEHAQPWLDEGMNTTSNQLVYWDAYGEDPWVVRLLGHGLTTKDLIALSMGQGGDRDPLDQPADRFDPLVKSYGTVTYQKTAAVMLSLRELCGREAWDRAMAVYAERARFRHPNGALLERTLVEEIAGPTGKLALVGDGGPGTVWLDVQQFLDQGLRGAALPDFRLIGVGNRRRLGASGWHRLAEGEPLPPEPPVVQRQAVAALAGLLGHAPPEPPGEDWVLNQTPDDWDDSIKKLDDERVEGYVVVHRRSSFQVPVEVLVEFADGESQTLVWDGQAVHHRFNFPGRRVVRAVVDPRMQLLLEPNKLDNARTATDAADTPEDTLAPWAGDIAEAASLAALGGLGI